MLALSSGPSEFKKENTDLKNHCTFLSYFPIRTFFVRFKSSVLYIAVVMVCNPTLLAQGWRSKEQLSLEQAAL